MALSDNNRSQQTEFDLLADDYYRDHSANIAITGEDPEYFSRYKVKDFAELFKDKQTPVSILDFGSGIGNSIPYFREFLPRARLVCGDVSARSMEISKQRYPGNEKYIEIGDSISAKNDEFNSIFTACVFHHIAHSDHRRWLGELYRVAVPGGVLAIYEHNPLNPLTVRAVSACPIDVNARLIRAGTLKRILIDSGWREVNIEYKVFFPSALKRLRVFESRMKKIFLGAQYRVTAIK
jgi:SAM-dependent methyltransferase